VVDDFVPWRNYVIAKLVDNPSLHIIGFAPDGLEAVRKAAELQPDLILMDVNLPTLSGISAARRIQELSLHTKILFVSQILDLEVALAALDAGGLGYVVKSDAENELLTAVETVMSGERFVSALLASRDFTGVLGPHAPIRVRTEESIELPARRLMGNKRFGPSHDVEFYGDDVSFLDRCTRFIGTALANGDSVILAATLSHANTLRQRLESQGCDVVGAIGCGRYLALKPADLVAEFLMNDQPDSARFIKTVTTLFETALKAANRNHPRVAACGECSALLYAEGRAEAAVEIERLLHEFARARDVDILCGYPIEGFRREEERSIFQRICAEHSSVYSQ
jgi:DNA-binding NarL/FixJ family response regulator